MSAGAGLVLIAVIITLILVGVSPLIRKVTNCYFFWAGLGLIFAIYLIIFRLGTDWKYFNSNHYYDREISISKALLLDLCPFTALMMPVCLVVDPTRKLAAILAPYAIFGGAITLFGEITTDPEASWSAQYIFSGIQPNPCYYSMHVINFLLGAFVLVNTPKLGLKGGINCVIFILFYFLYVSLCVSIFGVSKNVTGVTGYDWVWGEYNIVGEIFKNMFGMTNENSIMFLGYFLATFVIVGIIAGFTLLMNTKYFKIKDKINYNFIKNYNLKFLLKTYSL